MATLACYAAQVALIVAFLQFAMWAGPRGATGCAVWCVIAAILTAIFWECRYTLGCS